jgi:hypothetical protein
VSTTGSVAATRRSRAWVLAGSLAAARRFRSAFLRTASSMMLMNVLDLASMDECGGAADHK